jgi:3-dehydro-L-gulonate 2-dehydrogenase
MTRVPYDDMLNEFLRVLLKYGFRRDRAELCARLFADASRDGVPSHGLNRFPIFIDDVRKGNVKVHAEPLLVESFGALERWDGRQGPGPLNAHFCMGRAIEMARQGSMGCVALKNTNHWQRAGNYGWQAAEAGCIGICWTNTMPLIPPWGARERRLGNNPLVIAVPRPEGHLVLDMALAQFAGGKVHIYQRSGELLPVEGGYDREGRLTRDANEIVESKRPLPIGYWKGSGLALMLDLVISLLSGGLATHEIGKLKEETRLSQMFMAFDLARLAPGSLAGRVVNDVVDSVHSAEPADENSRILYPGERALAERRENLQRGVPVEPSLWQNVKEL